MDKELRIDVEYPVIPFARDILAMRAEIIALRNEVEDLREYKEKYFDLLDSSINHGREMSSQVLTLLLNKGEFPNDDKEEEHV